MTVGRITALGLMVVGQVIGAMLLLALEFTSGKALLSSAALLGFVGYVTGAWFIRRDHPYGAVLLTVGGAAALFGLLVFANSQGWLGA